MNPLTENLLSTASWVNDLLLGGAALALAIVVLKLLGRHEFETHDIRLSTRQSWLPFALMTGGHAYLAVLLIRAAYKIHFDEPSSAKPAWESLVNSGPLFFRGLLPRVDAVQRAIPGDLEVTVIRMDHLDPTTWLAHVGAVLLFFAISTLRRSRWSVRFGTTAAAVLLVVTNWIIGGYEIVAVSQLARGGTQSSFFDDLRAFLGG